MKRFIYLLMFSVCLVFMASSCGSGAEKTDDHGHEHGEGIHDHDHDHTH